MDSAKGNNPQKNYIKVICKGIYYIGMGDCWYEANPQTRLQQRLYKIWMVLSNLYAFLFVINEYLAHLRSDLNEKEQNDLVQFSLAHSSISAKIIIAYLKRKRISKVLERLLEGTRSVFVSKELDEACVKRSFRLCVAVALVVFMALLTSTFDAIRAHFTEGILVRTEVTLYPPPSATGLLARVLRYIVQFHWWFIVTSMLIIDSLCISSLVIVGHKFKLVQVYFSSLREKVVGNFETKDKKTLKEEFKKNFVVGIKLHDDALWCAKNIQDVLGPLYGVQVVESVVLLVMCLIKLVTVEHNLMFLLANFAYVSCLITLTGAYMMPAGDITYEASSVSTKIFHSGWELVSSRDLRVLIVLALQRSQVPVYMNAFRIFTLSYTSFISVIRSSYSFFAVMY